jgi:uncharacterized integral membrane protein
MLVLGLILILLSAGSLVAVIASGTDDHALMYGGSLELPTLVVFLAGAVAMLLFLLGLELVRSGIRRANEHRRNKKRLRKLERREELRQDETADGATVSTAPEGGTRPEGGTTPEATAPQGGTTQGGTTAPQGETPGEGPYETPPPAGR